jgi:hypothetical protein
VFYTDLLTNVYLVSVQMWGRIGPET